MRRHGRTGTAALLAGAAAMAALSGCDTSGGDRPGGAGPTVTHTRTVTGEPAPESSGSGTGQGPGTTPEETATERDAASVVEDYYAAVNARDYRRAWDLGGKNLNGSYDAFVAGFADTAHDTVRVVGASGGTVTVTLEAEQRDGSVRSFAGTYTVRGGTITAADIRAVPGPSPSSGGGTGSSYPPGPPAGIPDVDCSDLPGPVYVGPSDPHRLDRDGDGIGCEPYDK
ncbi:excalibur calcium-binding domain-containing protein [Streptomyces sp. NPDC007100]|uniref:excalibur calcium-binding domain-containing protein n=1 Tax=Streptomyces sp. NPDC007100 TaxID=3155602 RepID=UPI0033D7C213